MVLPPEAEAHDVVKLANESVARMCLPQQRLHVCHPLSPCVPQALTQLVYPTGRSRIEVRVNAPLPLSLLQILKRVQKSAKGRHTQMKPKREKKVTSNHLPQLILRRKRRSQSSLGVPRLVNQKLLARLQLSRPLPC